MTRRFSYDARALKGRTRQDKAQHWAGAGRSQQSRCHAEQDRLQHCRALRPGTRLNRPGKSCAQGDKRLSNAVGKAWKKKRQSEQRQQPERDTAAVLVGLHRPVAGHRCQRGDGGKRYRHADEHRQSTAQERAVGPRKYERQHGQDARTNDG
jgi:hypothetical protein